MAVQLIITAVGPDRPGLVDQISGQLLEAGANIADSRMINLAGQFALMMLARLPVPETPQASSDVDSLVTQLIQTGSSIGLAVSAVIVQPSQDDQAAVASKALGLRLRVFGMDKPGIVHRISNWLHEQDVNIEEMQTHLQAGSYTGTPQFTMDLQMSVPGAIQVSQLRTQLVKLCDSLNCDMDLEPA
jgi:glycine cleavage system transcriptional repressor